MKIRREMLSVTKKVAFLDHSDTRFWHGRAYSGPEQDPEMTWECDEPPRDDHDCPEWLKASEYQDVSDVIQAKSHQLAQLMRCSKKTVIYTGAGISASVVGQAARGGASEQGWKEGGGKYAKPTITHFLLGYLGRAGFIDEWVQQNHDGLPQKAGFPQEKINEVHGSWYDPSNPVVKYGGYLRSEESKWMKDVATTADLVIVLGTSLGGLNADQVATNAAHRSLKGRSLGTVCINLQQTPQDGIMTLRMFGKSDDVLGQVCKCLRDDLARNLGLENGQKLSCKPPRLIAEPRALVPYDAEGHRIEGTAPWMWLDLNPGKEVKITAENNIQGCKQPAYKHIAASLPVYNVERKDITFSPGDLGLDITKKGLVSAVRDGPAKQKGVQSQWIMRRIIVEGDSKAFSARLLREVVLEGTADFTAVFDVPRFPAGLTGVVSGRDAEACCFHLNMSGTTMCLGIWWLEAATRGAVKTLPVTNVCPEFAPAP
jgi:NAD-dependent SIR2 family protein deacetylase